MPQEEKPRLRLEIAHVLFIDIVGYSKFLLDEQSDALQELNRIVRNTAAARTAEATGQLVVLPTGDGMALAFTGSVEDPVECALQIGAALRTQPGLPMRMGIHSGPVRHFADVNERDNIAGAGINIAQRVMDCGDAGHILISKRVADDLAQSRRWQPYLHDLGTVEVKHGTMVSLVNLCTDDAGNASVPARISAAQKPAATSQRGLTDLQKGVILAVSLICVGIPALIFTPGILKSLRSAPEKSAAYAANAVPEKSIAVLPFENLSDDKDAAYFADGIQDEILTRLASIADLKVISRTSTRRFKSAPENVRQIAQQLGVVHLLEGSVQKSNDQVRVNVQLINATKDAHVWAETYDRKWDDIFAIEAEIATRIAEMFEVKLSGSAKRLLAARPTENPQAHQAYLQGAFYHARGTEADYRKAIEFYQNAIRLDPQYAMAQTQLAITWINLARKFLTGDEAQQAYAEARSAVQSALALDPNLAAAHTARGLLLESADFDWEGAEAEYRRALELAPHDNAQKTTLALSLATQGHPDQAVDWAREELTSDPLCASCYNWLSTYLSALGRLDEAEEAIRKAIDLQPGHADFHTQLTVISIQRGDARAALEAALKEVEEGGWQDVALALAQQISGDPAAAAAALRKLIETQANDAGYQIAQVYALRNDPNEMFEWLERAWSNRDPGVSQLLYDPFILRYRADPRFASFCKKVGLPALESR